MGVWRTNAHLLTVVFVLLVLIGDAFRSFRFCQQARGKIVVFVGVPGKGLLTPGLG